MLPPAPPCVVPVTYTAPPPSVIPAAAESPASEAYVLCQRSLPDEEYLSVRTRSGPSPGAARPAA